MQASAQSADAKAGLAADSPLDAEPEEEEDSGLGYDETATASVRAPDASAPTQAAGELQQAVNQSHEALIGVFPPRRLSATRT